MSLSPDSSAFAKLYHSFSTPITNIDCGEKCGPYNDYGIPVCCDIHQLVPSAFEAEWNYLESMTNLWRKWEGSSTRDRKELLKGLESGQVPLQCLGHQHCQRQFRTLTCRAFPFLPYLNKHGVLIGFTYYPEYQEQCWIISNLSLVTQEYKKEFQGCFQEIFELYPIMKVNYQNYSDYLLDLSNSHGLDLIYLDFNDRVFRVDPSADNPEEITYDDLQSFGPFKISKTLAFPDEIDLNRSGMEH
jgi:hypothetical protein